MRNHIGSIATFLFSGVGRLDHLEFGIRYPASLIYSHTARYSFASRFCDGKICLDVACGCAYGSQMILSSGASRVIGGDLQHSSLLRGKRRPSHYDLALVCLDAISLPFQYSSFDVVVSLETIEHLERPDEFLSQVARVMRADGIFICSTPNRTAISPKTTNPLNVFHHREFTQSEFMGLLSRHFSHVVILGQGRIRSNDIRLTKIANSLRLVGARFQFFERLLTVASAILRRDLRFIRLEDAIAEGFSKLLPYEPYNLDKADSEEPLSLVALARKSK